MQKITLVFIFLISGIMSFSQKKADKGFIVVGNLVEFYTDSVFSNPAADAIRFTLKVTNKTKKPIPDLGVTNRIKYVNFYINGKVDNPLNLYNGTEAIASSRMILENASEIFIIYKTISISGFLGTYGNEFTVQWEYMGKKSRIAKVNVEKKLSYNVKSWDCRIPLKK